MLALNFRARTQQPHTLMVIVVAAILLVNEEQLHRIAAPHRHPSQAREAWVGQEAIANHWVTMNQEYAWPAFHVASIFCAPVGLGSGTLNMPLT